MKNSNTMIHVLLMIVLGGAALSASALEFGLPAAGNDLVGQEQTVALQANEDLHKIGRRFDIGYYEMVEANRQLAQQPSLAEGTSVVIPSRFILPPGERKGLVINLAEMRLYYYPPTTNTVITYPLGIGRLDWETPLGMTEVVAKTANPTWRVPASIKAYNKENGIELPDVVPPGPKNPLGKFAFRLKLPGYLIHGTNHPSGVGMRSSSGCLRLFPEDIAALFKLMPVGTPVRIINEPYKLGWYDNQLHLEAHQPLQEYIASLGGKNSLTPMVQAVLRAERGNATKVDWQFAETIAEAQRGIPHVIGALGHLPALGVPVAAQQPK